MKNISFKITWIAVLMITGLSVSAQLKVNSSGKVGIGGDPTVDGLRIYNPTIPSFLLEGISTRLQIGVATSLGAFSAFAEVGDIVYRPLGAKHGLIFYMPNTDNNGNSYIKFGDAKNLGWVSIFNNKKMQIDGNVGIGRSPSYMLDVNGKIQVEATLISSDERLKTEIRSLSDEKDKLFLLNGKSYKKTPRPSGIEYVKYSEDGVELPVEKREIIDLQEYGYLAQELIKVFPDLVSQDNDGYYGINYTGLIPVIVEAVKDQKLVIEKQQLQIEELQNAAFSGAFRSSLNETGTTGIVNLEATQCKLYRNEPNPFTKDTNIRFYIPDNANTASLNIYDLQGKQLMQITIVQRGESSHLISGHHFSAGMYLYALIVDGTVIDTKRMILTK